MVGSPSEGAWGWELARVYVSSTIADLTGERQAVLDWLRLARHQAVDSYLPDSDTVRDSCLDDVAGCDLYVLIAGHRYGSQPPGDNPEGLSITQLEFRRAGECGIPRVALLRTSIPDVRLSDLQDPVRAALVLGFRDEVAGAVRPAEFGDLKGLIQGLSTGIQHELDKLGKRDERRAGPVAGRALRPVFLAGREELLAGLDARLGGGDGAGPRVVALCGLGGAGKTSVALEYAHRLLGEVGVAWQFGAEDPAVLAAGFGELAAQLGAAGRRDPVAAVHAVLAASQAPWLLPLLDDELARDAAGARDQYAALVQAYERVLGAEHPHTLSARGNLAYWTGRAGDAAGAQDQYVALVPVYERVLGAEHPDTLTVRGNLARWTGRAGDAAGARDQYAALLPVRERVLGPEHPRTLTTRANLAYWTRLAQNPE